MKSTALLLLVIGTLLSGCGTYSSYFGSGYHSLESSYLDKPHYDSLPRSAWYASARAIRSTGYNLNFYGAAQGDANQVYEAMAHYGHTYRNISWAGEVLGYYGRYRLGTQHDSALVDHFLSRHSFYGLGGKLSVNWNIPYRKINFRPIGVEVTLNREGGPYRTFVRHLDEQFRSVTTEGAPWSINVGLTSGLRAQLPDGIVLGYQTTFLIPDRNYRKLYRYYDNDKERREVIGGASTTVLLGY